MTDGAIWWIRNSVELYHDIILYSPDGITCHISSILHLTASVILQHLLYMLSPSLFCMYTCLASDFSGKFNIFILHGRDQEILWLDLIGGRKKLPLILVEFLTVQTVVMVNVWTVNGAVPLNSIFTRWHHLSH